jgi:hypothetical protein
MSARKDYATGYRGAGCLTCGGLLIRLPPMAELLQCGLPLCGAGDSACSRLSGGSLWGRQRGTRIDQPQVYNLPYEVAEIRKEWLA